MVYAQSVWRDLRQGGFWKRCLASTNSTKGVSIDGYGQIIDARSAENTFSFTPDIFLFSSITLKLRVRCLDYEFQIALYDNLLWKTQKTKISKNSGSERVYLPPPKSNNFAVEPKTRL